MEFVCVRPSYIEMVKSSVSDPEVPTLLLGVECGVHINS